ncbi:hypothetical protein J31TS6_03950 [Brevibacillus reuszeri]|uniref:DUF7832 domain-containing protein n=1 Tax=Brevibacillus reuszeri TaxID=54915 RepID=UPI001B1A2E3B|nr:hypothetical protein [Brevibacillus reuszeri]GIO04367.1 hypothetical protein J31TS6_03950 [Brevibacillus reuszeri]
MDKIETVLAKQRKTFKDYRHLVITVTKEVCIVNIIKGRLYADKKTMNPIYEPYPTKQEAVDRLTELADELKSKGFSEEPREVLFQIPEKEIYVFDKAKNWDGVLSSKELSDEADEFAREYLNIQNDVYTADDFTNVRAAGLPTIYHVEDSIENYQIIEPVINARYQAWKRLKDSGAASS